MKTKLFVFLIFVFNLVSFSQEKENLFKLNLGDKEFSIGGYLELSPKYSTFDSKSAGYMGFRGEFIVDGKWGVGIAAYGLWYDKSLNKLVSDGTYHINAGYSGIVIERIFTLNEDFILNVSILAGQGTAFYKYDTDYRKEKIWYQEIIDKDDFSVIEPQLEINTRISKHFWIGAGGSFRFTSPIKMIDTDENILKTASYGLSIKYGIF
jgi:hypothetical protein